MCSYVVGRTTSAGKHVRAIEHRVASSMFPLVRAPWQVLEEYLIEAVKGLPKEFTGPHVTKLVAMRGIKPDDRLLALLQVDEKWWTIASIFQYWSMVQCSHGSTAGPTVRMHNGILWTTWNATTVVSGPTPVSGHTSTRKIRAGSRHYEIQTMKPK